MPFNRPTLVELKSRIQADMISRLELVGGVMRRSVIGVLSTVFAGCSHVLHGHLDWISQQIMTDTMDEEHLIREASIYGIKRKPAAKASGNIQFQGEEGAIVPAGLLLKRSDGAFFITKEDGLASVRVEAQEAGVAGNCIPATAMSLVTPVSGVQNSASVIDDGITGGSDIEDIESLRKRILFRKSEPPMGGARHDYISWALAVPGVTRAWCLPHIDGLGSVGVLFVRDENENFIPDGSEIQTVQDYIELMRPVTASSVYVDAPTPVEVDFTLRVSPDTESVRQEITAEIQAFIRREAEPGATLYLSRISESISASLNEYAHEILLPAANISFDPDEIGVLGTVTFDES
ncbi:MAG: baseplate J/gp47 family protein [Clostridia bacterium]|nr:baseplate J/gp47 family protein [Clostridia bacterium]